MVAQQNLKVALTHPTILKFLKTYMEQQNSAKYLSFYNDATIIRDICKDSNYENAYELMIIFTNKYLDEKSDDYIEIREKARKLLLSTTKIIYEHKDDNDSRTIKISNSNLWVEGIRMAQYEVFFIIQEKYWLSFCESDLYNTMIKRKEVRTMISLFKNNDNINNNTKTLADSFSSLGLRS